jgi:hypothetical protein
MRVVGFAQLLFYGLKLLPQKIIPLRFAHFLLNFGLYLFSDAEHLFLARQMGKQHTNLLRHAVDLEQLLPYFGG